MTFPEDLPARQAYILSKVEAGEYQVSWETLRHTEVIGGKEVTLELSVTASAIKVDGVRVNVTAVTQQKIADRIGALLLTPKIADLIATYAVNWISPKTRTITSSVAGMKGHSDAIEACIKNPGLCCNVGKHWVIDNDLTIKPGRAMNYGWHDFPEWFKAVSIPISTSGPATRARRNGKTLAIVQSRGTAHDPSHTDYSQTCSLVLNACLLDGQPWKLSDILTHPIYSQLVSHQGPLRILRQPGVETYLGPFILSGVSIMADFTGDPSVLFYYGSLPCHD